MGLKDHNVREPTIIAGISRDDNYSSWTNNRGPCQLISPFCGGKRRDVVGSRIWAVSPITKSGYQVCGGPQILISNKSDKISLRNFRLVCDLRVHLSRKTPSTQVSLLYYYLYKKTRIIPAPCAG